MLVVIRAQKRITYAIKKMNFKKIVVKESFSSKIMLTVIFSAIPFIIYCKMQNKLFHWQNFNPNGIFTIVFLVFTSFGLLCWIRLFDDKPLLIINSKGFWFRTAFFPFSPLTFFDWNDIDFVELNTKLYAKGERKTVLIINKKKCSQTKTIILDDLDYSMDEIISSFREFSKFLNYRDRIDIKN